MSRHLIARSLASASRSSLPSRSTSAVVYQAHNATRAFSYVLDGWGGRGGTGSSWQWPITKANTVFNIVPQGYKYVVERFGKLHSIQDSGYFFAIPWVDQIAYIIDVRERAMDIAPQAAITRDNVSVEVSGNLFIKFQDPQAAAYGALNPLYSVTQVSQRTAKKWKLVLFVVLPRLNDCLLLVVIAVTLITFAARTIGHAFGDWRNGIR
jgi:hypothetical protein